MGFTWKSQAETRSASAEILVCYKDPSRFSHRQECFMLKEFSELQVLSVLKADPSSGATVELGLVPTIWA